MRPTVLWIGLVAAVVALAAVGCAATPAEHSYVTDYQVVGDKTIKYIYLPGEESRAGGGYLDQGLAVEICSLEPEAIDDDAVDEEAGDTEDGEVEADDGGDDGDGGEAQEVSDAERRQYLTVETDCEQSRLLLTEEFR